MSLATPETRFAGHRGQQIAYDVTGDGPPVVLLHWMLVASRRSWHQLGYVAALGDRFRVICVDALGHGESDKPTVPEAYRLANTAGSVAAVLDAEQVATAHVVGYSLGGWHTVGMLRDRPERMRSAVIGGWDPVGGLASQPPQNRDFETVLAAMQAAAPALVAWVADDNIRHAVRAHWEAMSDLADADHVLKSAQVPTALWCGTEDGPYAAVTAIAREIPSLRLLSVGGDHAGAILANARESAREIGQFLDRVVANEGRSKP